MRPGDHQAKGSTMGADTRQAQLACRLVIHRHLQVHFGDGTLAPAELNKIAHRRLGHGGNLAIEQPQLADDVIGAAQVIARPEGDQLIRRVEISSRIPG